MRRRSRRSSTRICGACDVARFGFGVGSGFGFGFGFGVGVSFRYGFSANLKPRGSRAAPLVTPHCAA